MRAFAACPTCRGEYETPEGRRFHSEPLASQFGQRNTLADFKTRFLEHGGHPLQRFTPRNGEAETA
jgi:hydrogenase maturation factor HypF (carbamoyltransferase family)